MASRMDRYNGTSNEKRRRIRRNENLYDSIYDDTTEYSNVEGIARIEKTNEVDLKRIREMLIKREEEKPKEERTEEFKRSIELAKAKPLEETMTERNYDVRDILNKAKSEKGIDEENKYRDLKNTQYNILKKIKLKKDFKKEDYEKELEEKKELRELIHTITNKEVIKEIKEADTSLDMFSDLKSATGEIDSNSIKKILEEAKEKQKEETEKTVVKEIDKSFFTSSLNFGDDDFEDLRKLNKRERSRSVIIKILGAIILIALIIIFVLYFMNLPK